MESAPNPEDKTMTHLDVKSVNSEEHPSDGSNTTKSVEATPQIYMEQGVTKEPEENQQTVSEKDASSSKENADEEKFENSSASTST